ncbi:MAG: DNA repair protein RadA [Candidatus Omnitrophica bacterium]|nr:DNA repair protein RadA [Candidatus Omnitrophota bacterium]
MMKTKTEFICQECGYATAKWIGRCPECSTWNSLVEEVNRKKNENTRRFALNVLSRPERLGDVKVENNLRVKTDISELDHVLGGGVVEGSVVLFGGAPGIGKSTLLLQVCAALRKKNKKILYISAEESAQQTKLRAERLNAVEDDLYIVCETNLDIIFEHIKKIMPDVIIADSIQVLYTDDITSASGSVSQVRECASRLTILAKKSGIAVFLVGHVTKDGSLAGPRVLEHLVDTVLYFEGETHTNFRILRAVKNRFGSTNEIGIFEMTSGGLKEVENPSVMFLTQRQEHTSGSAVVATMEGTRPLLVEIQALVSPTNFGLPRRRATGIDLNRAALLIAVLEKRAQCPLQSQDVFLNVAGGVKIVEPAADLAAVAAIFSSFREKPLLSTDVIFGEVGLGGEIRAVTKVDLRIKEVEKMGFKRVIMPANNLKTLGGMSKKSKIEIIGVSTVKEAMDIILEKYM